MRAVRLLIVRLSTGHGLVLLRARATGQHGPNNLVDTPRLYFLYLRNQHLARILCKDGHLILCQRLPPTRWRHNSSSTRYFTAYEET